jgi:hypothetical protein
VERLRDDVIALMRRHPYRCWLTVLRPHEADSFDAVAEAAGLKPLGRHWHEFERVDAEALLTHLLHRSLAYDVELMPEKTAAWLAIEFLNSVGSHGARFATNTEPGAGGHFASWAPASEYTFDAGLIAMSHSGSALYWVADED